VEHVYCLLGFFSPDEGIKESGFARSGVVDTAECAELYGLTLFVCLEFELGFCRQAAVDDYLVSVHGKGVEFFLISHVLVPP